MALGWFDSINYHPQRSWGKVMFLHMSVILFTGDRGVCVYPRMQWADPPRSRGRYPPGPEAGTPQTRGRHPLSSPPMGPEAGTTPQRSACSEIRATSGLYASYWNAILFFSESVAIVTTNVSVITCKEKDKANPTVPGSIVSLLSTTKKAVKKTMKSPIASPNIRIQLSTNTY